MHICMYASVDNWNEFFGEKGSTKKVTKKASGVRNKCC